MGRRPNRGGKRGAVSERKRHAAPPPPKTPPGIGIPETRGGGTKTYARPLTGRALRQQARLIHDALDDIARDYREVHDWCYSLPENRSFDKPIVQVSDPWDPTGQTVIRRKDLSRALEKEVCRRVNHAYNELAGAANWLRDIQEQGRA